MYTMYHNVSGYDKYCKFTLNTQRELYITSSTVKNHDQLNLYIIPRDATFPEHHVS